MLTFNVRIKRIVIPKTMYKLHIHKHSRLTHETSANFKMKE